jgi:hypothetical protein
VEEETENDEREGDERGVEWQNEKTEDEEK